MSEISASSQFGAQMVDGGKGSYQGTKLQGLNFSKDRDIITFKNLHEIWSKNNNHRYSNHSNHHYATTCSYDYQFLCYQYQEKSLM